MNKQITGLLLGPAIFLLTLVFVHPAGMSAQAHGILASTLWIAIWWITEAVPIPITSLLPIVLFPCTGGLGVKATAAAYGSPLIFLFVGGFIIAVAIEKWNLHKRIAMNIIKAVGASRRRLILGFMLATAFLSMWLSNTATTMMMMPIGLAIIKQLSGLTAKESGQDDSENKDFGRALMLAIAYSASIGGMATLIGTPTNVIFSGVVKQLYDADISFAQWFLFGLPVSAVLLVVCWHYLVRWAFSFDDVEIPGGREEVEEQLRALGEFHSEEKWVMFVFGLTALAWISRSFVLAKILPGINDSAIAITGAVLLFLIPAKSRPGSKLLDWESASKIPWGIILLFGGGLSLAAGFQSSGLANWIGDQMTLLQGVPVFILLAVVVVSVNFLTEITSNVATASMILPILASLSMAINVHPFTLMVGATVAASCAFMLPVATPPNAVVFGSGYLRMQDMIRAGFRMNLISIVFITIYVYLVLPLLWNIDPGSLPELLQ